MKRRMLLELSVVLFAILFGITVAQPSNPKSATLSITTKSLPGGKVNSSYSANLSASGGTTPYSWSVTAGSLPPGLSLNSLTGTISGTPTNSGTSSFTVQVKDSSASPQTATKSFSIAIAPPPLTITTSSLPGGTVNSNYSATLTASGGTLPYTWTVSRGSLPAGLSLNSSTGVISGTPSKSGTASFTVQVKDSSSTAQTAKASLSIAIVSPPPPLVISTTSLPCGTVNFGYLAPLSASGGTTPYSWTVSSGSLPDGLSMNSSTGAITGVPTTSGTWSFTVQVQDSGAVPQTTAQPFSLVVTSVSTNGIPATLFAMHIQKDPGELFSGEPWPSVGIGSIRLWDTTTHWFDLEPSRGTFDWTTLDNYLNIAAANGATVEFTFGGTPQWASSNPTATVCSQPGSCYPPTNIADWDDFVKALVDHAGSRIEAYELWNEAGQPEYWSGTAAQLVQMAQDAYNIIKAAQPNAIVLSPSVSQQPDLAMDAYFQAGGNIPLDAVAFHMHLHSAVAEDAIQWISDVRADMAQNGLDSKPLWMTEGGYDDQYIKNLSDRPPFVGRYYLMLLNNSIPRGYWYAWNDSAYGTMYDVSTESILPPGIAFGQIYNWLVGASLTAPCTLDGTGTWTCPFTRVSPSGYQALAIWNPNGSVSYTPAGIYTQYRDLAGNTTLISGAVTIGPSPILLETSAP